MSLSTKPSSSNFFFIIFHNLIFYFYLDLTWIWCEEAFSSIDYRLLMPRSLRPIWLQLLLQTFTLPNESPFLNFLLLFLFPWRTGDRKIAVILSTWDLPTSKSPFPDSSDFHLIKIKRKKIRDTNWSSTVDYFQKIPRR